MTMSPCREVAYDSLHTGTTVVDVNVDEMAVSYQPRVSAHLPSLTNVFSDVHLRQILPQVHRSIPPEQPVQPTEFPVLCHKGREICTVGGRVFQADPFDVVDESVFPPSN